MKLRIIKAVAATAFILAFITAGSGTDARIQRWENRIETLSALNSKTAPGDVLPVVTDILKRGMESSRNIKSILERYASHDGSLRADTKKYSVAEIEKITKETALPAVSAWYLLATADRLSDSGYFTKVLSWIAAYANSKQVTGIRAGAPGVSEMVRACIMEMHIDYYSGFEASALKKILGRVEYELSRTDYNFNDIDLGKLIIETAAAELELMIKEFDPQFNEKVLLKVPEWKLIESSSMRKKEKDIAGEQFAVTRGIPAENVTGKGIDHAENLVFGGERSSLISMIESSGPAVSAGSGTPSYSIPDLKKFTNPVEEIDRYRLSLLRRIDDTGDSSFSTRASENTHGIAEKYISLYENAYKKEELRVAGIKKTNAKLIVYNEEVFFASKKHFDAIKQQLRAYADLSSDFIKALAGRGVSTPDSYMADLNYMSGRYIEYVSFFESLSKNLSPLGKSANAKNHGIVKEGVKDSLDYIHGIYKSFTVPAEIRKNMTKEQVKELASINQSYRSQVTLTASLIRRNHDDYNRLYNEAISGNRKTSAESEIRIAQMETDALFGFAKECNDAIAAMDTTGGFLKEYKAAYDTASADISKNGSSSRYVETINKGSLLQLVKSYSPDSVKREVLSRDILARQGNEALSGAVTLCRYYAGKGLKVQVVPAENEIRQMRGIFAENPEISVASWTMTGRNIMEVDSNCTETLRKMINKNVWTSKENTNSKPSRETVSHAGVNVSFEKPAGWTTANIECQSGSGMKLESPDKAGTIEIYVILSQTANLQEFSSAWSTERGFTMVEKGWGRINDGDYFRTVCKGRSGNISETRMAAKNGTVIIVSGFSAREKARYMNGVIEKLFSGISF